MGVVTAPPRPSGRGQRLTTTPIEAVAIELGIPKILRPRRLRDDVAIADVQALDPELVVLADYGQIVPSSLLDVPLGALNLHPSLLPRHRGASPIPATILAGDAETGVTLMRMDAGLDTGPIVAQERIRLAGDEHAPALEARLAELGAALLMRSLPGWLRGELPPRAQAVEGASVTRPLRRVDGRLDPAQPAERLERQVRAYQPWPGSWLETPAGRLTVWRARVVPGSAGRGELVRVGSGVGLGTVHDVLELLEVQPAGGRRMSGAELVRGRPALVAG